MPSEPMPETRTALILLTVPKRWEKLDAAAIAAQLRNQSHLIAFLAKEVKRCLDKPDVMDPRKMAERLAKAATKHTLTGEQAAHYLRQNHPQIWALAETGDTIANDVMKAYVTFEASQGSPNAEEASEELIAAVSTYAEKRGGGHT